MWYVPPGTSCLAGHVPCPNGKGPVAADRRRGAVFLHTRVAFATVSDIAVPNLRRPPQSARWTKLGWLDAATFYVVGQPAAYGRAVEQSKVDIERARTLLVF